MFLPCGGKLLKSASIWCSRDDKADAGVANAILGSLLIPDTNSETVSLEGRWHVLLALAVFVRKHNNHTRSCNSIGCFVIICSGGFSQHIIHVTVAVLAALGARFSEWPRAHGHGPAAAHSPPWCFCCAMAATACLMQVISDVYADWRWASDVRRPTVELNARVATTTTDRHRWRWQQCISEMLWNEVGFAKR